MISLQRIVVFILILTWISCTSKKESMFTPLFADKTGLNFTNTLSADPNFNLFSYMYYYNGAGIGAGDFNNDGLVDLFFAANRSGNKLFLNKGEMSFKEVTVTAGIPKDDQWSTGVSVVDINQDGLLDIYVCRVGNYKILKGKNSLFINQGPNKEGIPQFKDEAMTYGLDFSGYSTQAAFLDYDGDDDLDMFLLNHSVNHEGNYKPRYIFEGTYDSLAGHRLYQNNSKVDERGQFVPAFTDVTKTCGINSSKIGYGLGVAVADINLDGWPDLYVGNDFHENDYLYINQHNGTFKDESRERIMHTSQFSMGVDVADITNDAHPEIISMDMLPYEPNMLRRSLSEDDYTIFRQKIEYGYTYQYARNNLQLNRGNGRFTEAGQYAGIFATDWSWASLWMDFNNDGNKDLFVSNGIPKRMNDIDYVNFVSGEELQRKLSTNSLESKDMTLLNKFPEIKIPNQFFLNKGDVRFSNLTDSIYKNPSSFSNGSVYADLDNDGDLDIVVNNINDPVFIYQNNTNDKTKHAAYAQLYFKGSSKNTNAVGAKVLVFEGSKIYSYESTPVHGFLSSMQIPLHIGLANIKPDSTWIVWPDQRYENYTLRPGKRDTIAYKPGLPKWDASMMQAKLEPASITFEDIAERSGIQFKHEENWFNEFDREPLIPNMQTIEGPALAVADINHDGLEDLFVGSSKTFHPAIYTQIKGGRFVKTKQPALALDSMWEHNDAVWQDVNGDQHVDLIIATGGNEYYGTDPHLKPLLYLNDGKGNLSKKEDAFGEVYVTQSKILTKDLNGDGAVDLFIAGRSIPWQYGQKARSYLLYNDGKGKFTDVTTKWFLKDSSPGMITDAAWEDFNKDGKHDLVVTNNWGTIDAFVNKGNHFERKPLTDKKGWWQCFQLVDIDNDGDKDIVAGNLGLNSRLKASTEHPVRLYINDFDGNGIMEEVMSYYVGGKEIPFASKILLEKSLPVLKKKYLYAADFAKANMSDLLDAKKLKQSLVLEANCFENMVFVNQGDMQFVPMALPKEAQWTTYKTMYVTDLNKDGLQDIILGGNFYGNNVEIGRMDGDPGTALINQGKGKWASMPIKGVNMVGEIRKIIPIKVGSENDLLIARNNDSLLLIKRK